MFYATVEDNTGVRPDPADHLDNSGCTGTGRVGCLGRFQNPVERVVVGDVVIR